MIRWVLILSVLLNLLLLGGLILLNDRYGLWAKVQRVALKEGRVPGVLQPHELNRNYQVWREMFRLDRNELAKVLMLGDSLTAQGEWNAMLGESLVANRGIDGDTAAGVLARIGDDSDFRGDAVVIWIGTNDVLQGGAAGPVTEGIIEAARGKAEILKRNLTTKDTNLHEIGKIIDGKIIGTTESRHVVMQGQKWDRSDFFMLLPEAGAFNSPPPPNACRGERCGVWGRIAPIRLVGEFRMDWLMVLDGFGSARARF